MKISLSATQERKLLDAFNECIGFRHVEEEDGELFTALMRYAMGQSRRIELDDVIDIEFFSLYETLKEMLDTVLDHGVDARIYAFENVSDDYRDFIIDINKLARQSGEPTDSLLLTLTKAGGSSYTVDRREVMKDIKSRLDTLTVNCKDIFTLSATDSERLGVGGSYSPKTNTIDIFRGANFMGVDSQLYGGNLSPKEISSVSKEAYTALVAHSFLHELAHLCERCIPEQSIGSNTASQAMLQYIQVWARQMSQQTGAPEAMYIAMVQAGTTLDPLQDELSELIEAGQIIYGHCSRFKLALLYLTSIDTKKMYIRPELVPQIKKAILDTQLLAKDSSGDFVSAMKSTISDARDQAYNWEAEIYEQYRDAIARGGLVFRPKSMVLMTDDILAAIKRKGSRVYHNPYTQTEDYTRAVDVPEDLFYTVEGNANLLTMRYDGDAFGQIAALLQHMELVPSRSITVDIGDPFLGMTIEDGVVQYIYSDYGERFTKVTLEEAWWLLTL